MSDFLVSLGKQHSGKDLVNLLKKPYRSRAPEGRFFDYPWGSVAILEERIACNKNIIAKNAVTFAWVGDLVTDLSDRFVELFIERISSLQDSHENNSLLLRNDELFEKLNGTFAIVLAEDKQLNIVTDPLSFVPVYMGKNDRGNISSFGTHPDLVSVTSGRAASVDVVSTAEFLNMGHTTFPYTMYSNVEELEPGSLHCVKIEENGNILVHDFSYWSPPQELTEGFNVTELAEELEQLMISAVRDRCSKGKIGVCLSGGLDSRLIMAAVPEELKCVGLTFGDRLNLEMKTAQRVSRVYNRRWFPLFRDKHFLENTILNMVSLAGCEGDWVHAHAVGFLEKIEEIGVDILLTGNGVDEFLKGCHAVRRVKRLGGILPSKYVKRELRYKTSFSVFIKGNIKEDVLELMRARRKEFYSNRAARNPKITVELLSICPISQSCFCLAERRLLPIRTCGADRRILDFGFKCPLTLKLGNQMLFMACEKVYGRGFSIPNANDGVRPCSGRWSRPVKQTIHNLRTGITILAEKLGRNLPARGSWPHAKPYWQKSNRIPELIREYGPSLDEWDEKLFKERGRDLFKCEVLKWSGRFRLLQLAIWKGMVDDYKP